MQERIARTQNVFYAGLFAMLVTAILSATAATGAGFLILLTLSSALTSMAARIRLSQLHRSQRRQAPSPDAWAAR